MFRNHRRSQRLSGLGDDVDTLDSARAASHDPGRPKFDSGSIAATEGRGVWASVNSGKIARYGASAAAMKDLAAGAVQVSAASASLADTTAVAPKDDLPHSSAISALGLQAEPQAMALAAAPNKITLENMKQGNPVSEWGIDGDGDGNIQGFATEISRNIGQTIDFKIATDSINYRIEIYRLGHYGGDGAR